MAEVVGTENEDHVSPYKVMKKVVLVFTTRSFIDFLYITLGDLDYFLTY
jgi:hypothetical protein